MPRLVTRLNICILLALMGSGLGLSLASPMLVSGVVTGPQGLPIPEAEVRLVQAPDALARVKARNAPLAAQALAITGADGRYELSAPGAGVWTVQVHASGFVPVEMVLAPLVKPMILPVARLAEDQGLEVLVADGSGAPINGAKVQLSRPSERRFFGMEPVWRPPTRWARSGPDGRAHLARSRNEAAWLSVSAREYQVFSTQRLRGSAIKVSLEKGTQVAIRALSQGGAPEEGVLVEIGQSGHALGLTDANGRIVLVLGPGETRLQLLASGGREISTHLAPTAQDQPQEVTFQIPPLRWIEGRLIDAETHEAIEEGVVWDSRSPALATGSGTGGGFRLSVPGSGRAELSAGAPLYLPSQPLKTSPDSPTQPTLALTPGAMIEGRITTSSGEAVAGASVSLSVKRGNSGMIRIEIGDAGKTPDALTGDDGRYRLGPVDPAKNWRLHVEHAGLAPGQQDLEPLAPYEHRTGVDLTLAEGYRATGRVVDQDGRAVAETTIRLTKAKAGRPGMHFVMPGQAPEGSYTATSDHEGAYEISGLPAGRFDAEATRRGFATTKRTGLEIGTDVGGTALEDLVLLPGASVEGWVVDSTGQAIEGAQVEVASGGGGMVFMMGGGGGSAEEPDATSGADGYFRVDDLAAGDKLAVTVSRRGFGKSTQRGVVLPLTDPLEFTLETASSVSGTISDLEGVPIAGADVQLTRTTSMNMGGNTMMMKMMEGATADADGRFLFEDLEPGKISLAASAPGLQEAALNDLEVPKGENLEGLQLKLPEGSIIDGQVLLSDSRPAIGVRVAPVSESEDPMPIGGARTDGEGRYRLDSITPGTLSIEATLDDGNRAVREIQARPGINKLDLQFSGGRAVSGRVVDTGGSPVRGALVQLTPAARPWGGPEVASDGAGAFRFDGVRPGSYLARVSREGFAAPLTPKTVQVGEEDLSGVELELGTGGMVEGQVTGIEERLYSEVHVSAFAGRGEGVASSGVDYEGRFELADLAPGAWTVRATIDSEGRKATAQTEVLAGTPAQVVLEFGKGLTLSGVALRDGQPVTEAIVNLRGQGVDGGGWSRTDSAGRFSIADLKPGSYGLDLRQWSTGLTHREDVSLDSNREIEIEIPVAEISGRIVDAFDHEPIPGVTVSLEAASGDPEGLTRLGGNGATTDVDGHFRLSYVTDGEWVLRAQKKGYSATSETVSIFEGRPVENLKLILEATEGLILDLRLASGSYPSLARVALVDPAGAVVTSGSYATGENGRLRLSSTPAGQWTAVVGVPGSGTVQVDVNAPGPPQAVVLGPASLLEIRIPELADGGVSATVTLFDSQGRPHRELGWMGGVSSSWRLHRGMATLPELPAGGWRVEVQAGDDRRWQGEITTTAGQTAVLEM